MEEKFSSVIDADEQIVKIVRPNKGKLFFAGLIKAGLIALLFAFVCFGFCIKTVDDKDVFVVSRIWIPIVVFAVIMLIALVCLFLIYDKTYYAYTNKRLLIRTGIIGVDYRALDLDMIGATNVNITLLDKIYHKNTGSITFGSMASPLNGQGANYRMLHVVKPYELYQEIKSLVAQKKNKEK